MRKVVCVLFLIVFLGPPLLAHRGRQVQSGCLKGCHNDRRAGTYHCHDTGKLYNSKADAQQDRCGKKPETTAPTPVSRPTLGGMWRGIPIADERRCSPFDRSDYRYPQSVEDLIINDLGGVWSPYTGECFDDKTETDIEHMVSVSEAHDSGLCGRDDQTRLQFARDTLNLTLADPRLNRHIKSGKDAAEWMPERNKCWFANQIVQVRRKYRLTIDRREAAALDSVLNSCASYEREQSPCSMLGEVKARDGNETSRQIATRTDCHFVIVNLPDAARGEILLDECTGNSWWYDSGVEKSDSGTPSTRNPEWRPINRK